MNTNGRELGQIRANLIIASERKLGRELNLTKAAAGKNLIKRRARVKFYVANERGLKFCRQSLNLKRAVKFKILTSEGSGAELNFISHPSRD